MRWRWLWLPLRWYEGNHSERRQLMDAEGQLLIVITQFKWRWQVTMIAMTTIIVIMMTLLIWLIEICRFLAQLFFFSNMTNSVKTQFWLLRRRRQMRVVSKEEDVLVERRVARQPENLHRNLRCWAMLRPPSHLALQWPRNDLCIAWYAISNQMFAVPLLAQQGVAYHLIWYTPPHMQMECSWNGKTSLAAMK